MWDSKFELNLTLYLVRGFNVTENAFILVIVVISLPIFAPMGLFVAPKRKFSKPLGMNFYWLNTFPAFF